MKMMQEKQQEKIGISGTWKFTIRDAKTGRIKRVREYKNVICTVGKIAIASSMGNGTPSPSTAPLVNYGALGSSTTTPSAADTQLGTETYRKQIASSGNDSAQAFFTQFYTATETSGTYKESGLFIGGSGTANSGTLLSHVAIDITKTTSETLTIDITIDIA